MLQNHCRLADLILPHCINFLENLLCPGWVVRANYTWTGQAWQEWVFDSSHLDMRWSALWSWSLSLEESRLASFSSCCTVRDIFGALRCSRLKLRRPVSAVLCSSYFLSGRHMILCQPTASTQQQPGRARAALIIQLVFPSKCTDWLVAGGMITASEQINRGEYKATKI